MAHKLAIGEHISLPVDAITQTFGILAMRGAGKSNLGATMAEEMFDAKLPFVAVDPVGSWWGLRSSADGKAAGLAIPIFGGSHGDVPLEKNAGALIADMVVADRLSCVVDVSEFSVGERTTFLIDFAERLYRRNRDPLHLFLEEADDYVPQRPMREQARCLRAFEDIVRRGRARGLGITMITQRSAALNKNVLTQIETLFVLRTTSPQDRKAIAAWVEYHAQADELLESLAQLEAGEAWVWSPSWLNVMKRVQIRRRRTFDSGATPKNVQGTRAPATLADVDLDSVREKMKATIERVKETDPRELKKRIAQLEREVRSKPAAKPDDNAAKAAAMRESRAEWSSRVAAVETQLRQFQKQVAARDAKVARLATSARHAMGALLEAIGNTVELPDLPERPTVPGPAHAVAAARQISPRVVEKRRPAAIADSNGDLSGPDRKILSVLAQFPDGCRANKLALLSERTYGGTMRNILASLRTRGLIEGGNLDVMRITDAGAAALGDFDPLPAPGEELARYWLARFGKQESAILKALIDHPDGRTADQLSTDTGYEYGGTFRNCLAKLRTAGVITGKNTETMQAAEELLG